MEIVSSWMHEGRQEGLEVLVRRLLRPPFGSPGDKGTCLAGNR
jgi:hypothetical protein